jgi:predicted house-cleaning noncanonical NTP pyrophosphatase (MazG superfamily)
MEEKKEQLKLTKSRWKLLREHIGRNIINSFQKTSQKNAEEEEIELILEEANAYNLRKEVKEYAEDILQKDDILISRINAYLMAYEEIINE